MTNVRQKPFLVALLFGVSVTAGLQQSAKAQANMGKEGRLTASTAVTLSPESAKVLAKDIYYYAYPLVLMEVTREQAVNVPNSTTAPMRAPTNQFAHFRKYPEADAKDVVRFNFDTLYSFAWVDLSEGPIILTVPDTQGRFYLVPTLDMWTDVFSSLGKRTTGTGAGNFAYVPPDWTGTLPEGVQKVEAPTSTIWVMGRTQTNGPSDYDNVHQIQDGLKLTPLASWGKPYVAPPTSPTDPKVDGKTPPLEQVANMSGITFFTEFAELLKTNPPHPNDYPILFRMKALGFIPGQSWDSSKLDPAIVAAINAAAKEAMGGMVKAVKGLGRHVDGWNLMESGIGTYGTSYLQRAAIALGGLGANLPEDAVYPTAFQDSEGKVLEGSNDYVLHFSKQELPPADGFWSLTMYDDQGFQVANPINRFAIGDRDKLKFNEDGSLDLYIQHKSPGKDKESNWLPSPATGLIGPTLRIYGPRANVLDGTWSPPAVKRVR